MMIVESKRRCLWFGTYTNADWFGTPVQGADSSPVGWGVDGTLLNGSGYVFNSWDSAKVYTYEWPAASTRQDAQKLKSYADGTYGRAPLVLLDPLIYDLNILPARVADPSMAVDDEGTSLVYGMTPTSVSNSGSGVNDLPVRGAYYDLANVPAGFRGIEDATFVPIPSGYTLVLGAFYEATGSGGIFISPQNSNGSVGAPQQLTALLNDAEFVVSDIFQDVPGVWLWLGKTTSGAATVTAKALIARLIESDRVSDGSAEGFGEGPFGEEPFGGVSFTPYFTLKSRGPWIGGMGNAGVRFVGKPTFQTNSGINGGRIGFAATFKEVSGVYG